jgi:hypothetical protein
VAGFNTRRLSAPAATPAADGACERHSDVGVHGRNRDRPFSEWPTIRSKLGAGTSNDSAFSVKLTDSAE